MQDPNFAKGHPLANEVDVYLDVLGTAMLNRVGRHVDGGHIVTVDQCSGVKWAMELLE